MKYVITDQIALSVAPQGPLAVYIVPFAESVSARGYCPYWIRRQVRLAAGFSLWLKQKSIELHRVTSDHPGRYLQDRARQVQSRPDDAA